jgi:hypothetical protein
MNSEKAVQRDLGIQVADGEDLRLSYVCDDLLGSFKDWREIVTTFRCTGVIAFRWQPIEYFREDERPDSTYEIVGSEWVRQHKEQGMIGSAQVARHFKLNFNAIGCLEVICAQVKKEPNQALQPNAGNAPSADEALPPRG